MPHQDRVQESPVRGDVIKRLRAENGTARMKLAVQAGVADSTWQRAERGESVSYRNLVKIARALGVPVSTIYEDAIDVEPHDDGAPAWFLHWSQQLDKRLEVIERRQREILRRVGGA